MRRQVFDNRGKPEAEWDWGIIHASEKAWPHCLRQVEQWLGINQYFAGNFSAAECALLPWFGIAEVYVAKALDSFP